MNKFAQIGSILGGLVSDAPVRVASPLVPAEEPDGAVPVFMNRHARRAAAAQARSKRIPGRKRH